MWLITVCYEVDKTWDVRIHMQSFYLQTWSQSGMGQTMANRYVEDKTQSSLENKRESLDGECNPTGHNKER